MCHEQPTDGWRRRRDRVRGLDVAGQRGEVGTLANPLQLAEVRGLPGVALRFEPQLDAARGDHLRKCVEPRIPPT